MSSSVSERYDDNQNIYFLKNTSLFNSENALLRSKWEAWTSCRGLSREQAMINFVREMEKFDSSFAEKNRDNRVTPRTTASQVTTVAASPSRTVSARVPASTSGQADNTSMKGILFKQR